jgi:hypothetical protein
LAEVAANSDSPPLHQPGEKVKLFTLWTRWH